MTEPRVSKTVEPNLERAINLDIDVICLFLGKDGELRTDAGRCNFATFLSTSVGKDLLCEGTQHHEGRMASGACNNISTEPHNSITVVPILARGFKLVTYNFAHVEPYWQEVDIVLVGLIFSRASIWAVKEHGATQIKQSA